MGSGVYEYVCGGSLGDLRNFFLTLSFLFLFISWNHFLFYVLVGFFFFKDFVFFSKSHFLFPLSFPFKYLSCFQLPRAQPKRGGTAMNRNAGVTCHPCHHSVPDFGPES